MGNQSSKPAGSQGPASPVANHPTSSSTTTTIRKEFKPQPAHRSRNVNTSVQETASYLDIHPHSANPSPSHRQRPDDAMGNEHSRQQAHESHKTEREMEREKEKERTKPSKTIPMKVPRGSDPKRQRGPDSQFEPSGPPRDPNYIPHSNLNFPPRLPLPIEEEVHAPGSPVIAPQGFSSSLDENDIDGTIPRSSSVVSSTTIEDYEAGNELQPYPYEQPPSGTVPTLLQWKKGGDRVYVTGTFAGWSRKYRMNRE